MEWDKVQILAGVLSSLIFATGTFTMLMKVLRTKEVEAYSFWSLLLNNLGNIVYWVYILSLPMGPIYFLHLFYTVSMIVMLLCYLIYHKCVESMQKRSSKIA